MAQVDYLHDAGTDRLLNAIENHKPTYVAPQGIMGQLVEDGRKLTDLIIDLLDNRSSANWYDRQDKAFRASMDLTSRMCDIRSLSIHRQIEDAKGGPCCPLCKDRVVVHPFEKGDASVDLGDIMGGFTCESCGWERFLTTRDTDEVEKEIPCRVILDAWKQDREEKAEKNRDAQRDAEEAAQVSRTLDSTIRAMQRG